NIALFENEGFEASHKLQRQTANRATSHNGGRYGADKQNIQLFEHTYLTKILQTRYLANKFMCHLALKIKNKKSLWPFRGSAFYFDLQKCKSEKVGWNLLDNLVLFSLCAIVELKYRKLL